MKIRLDSARFEPFRWQEKVTIPAADLDRTGVVSLAPTEVSGLLSFAEPNFVLELRLGTRAAVECDRCLKPVELDLEGRLQLMVIERHERPTKGAEAAEERELTEDELGVLEVAGDSLDTTPIVREQILLELPVKPLCREDCAGLCPTCGADRNLGACGCEARVIDPRWAALEAVRSKLDAGS